MTKQTEKEMDRKGNQEGSGNSKTNKNTTTTEIANMIRKEAQSKWAWQRKSKRLKRKGNLAKDLDVLSAVPKDPGKQCHQLKIADLADMQSACGISCLWHVWKVCIHI